MPDEQGADDAYRFLRAATGGELRYDERMSPLRFVIEPRGRLVAPVSTPMMDAVDCVLFVPELADGSMEVQVTLRPLDADGPDGGLTDRWRIYHGEPKETRWALLDIDAARYHEWVIDGSALMRPNPLAADEPGLCRQLNKDREALRRLCAAFAKADVENPMAVGVDPLGLDIRRRFDVIRVEAPAPMETPQDAARVLQRMAAPKRRQP